MKIDSKEKFEARQKKRNADIVKKNNEEKNRKRQEQYANQTREVLHAYIDAKRGQGKLIEDVEVEAAPDAGLIISN